MQTARQQLAEKALSYKKAWLFAIAWNGHVLRLKPHDLLIPNYEQFKKYQLVKHIEDPKHDYFNQLKLILSAPDRKKTWSIAEWMSKQFDAWQQDGGGLLDVCTADEFERQFGSLKAHEFLEVPPYTILVMQGPSGLAYRHPEYHLARDIMLLYSLYADAEELLSNASKHMADHWTAFASENAQSLARSVIIACFNLLESFVSGLARAHLATASALDEATRKQLLDNDRPLRTRIIRIPELIAGTSCGLDVNKHPLSTLFGEIKRRRDAIVHCEPGPHPSKYGYIKQEIFFDPPRKAVDDTVALTEEVIRHIWKCVYARSGPRWLPPLRGDAARERCLRIADPRSEDRSSVLVRTPPK